MESWEKGPGNEDTALSLIRKEKNAHTYMIIDEKGIYD